MNWIQPIGAVHDDGSLKRVDAVQHARIRRETDEEAAERRRREAQEREQQRQLAAAAGAKPIPASSDKPAIVHAEDAPDGHPHVDVRV